MPKDLRELRFRRIDAKIDSLPRQRNLHLVENQLRKYGVLAG